MTANLLPVDLADRCNQDGEFRIASRFWTGGFKLEIDETAFSVRLRDGAIVAGEVSAADAGSFVIAGTTPVWEALLSSVPPRMMNDIAGLVGAGALALSGSHLSWAQYYPAVARAVELARPPASESSLKNTNSDIADGPIGRYVRVAVEGVEYRVYFEEAGQGIPLLLQHTAGCHGSQWRHLMECREITDHFRLIAYDLPYHGKSLPPVGPKWWAEPYKLRRPFLHSFVTMLASQLGLERPAFMGCSVGGMLALDLARSHPDKFRAVISLEGGLKVPFDPGPLIELWHPQVSNDYKARLMNGLMSPTSPEAFRKETSMVYAAGWPPVFVGDLHYYGNEYDLREKAGEIDTSKIAVHILSGEYDTSGTVEMGLEAHQAIAGSTHTVMQGVGHFPMSENPQVFLRYILPILEQVRQSG